MNPEELRYLNVGKQGYIQTMPSSYAIQLFGLVGKIDEPSPPVPFYALMDAKGELFALTTDQTIAIRKAWDVGLELITLQ